MGKNARLVLLAGLVSFSEASAEEPSETSVSLVSPDLHSSDLGGRFSRGGVEEVPAAAAFLEDCRRGPDLLCLCWTTAMAYLRLVTHSAVVARPLARAAALSNIESLAALPHVRMLSELEGFTEVYREVIEGVTVRGNLVPDSHLAAILRQHGVTTLYTNDRDFRRFKFLDVRNPLR